MQRGLTERLLCFDCERKISRYESYAAALLRRLDAAFAVTSELVTIPDADVATFRLFGISLLWRCHVSKSHMFDQVKLGPHAALLREMIIRDDHVSPSTYPLFLAKVTGLDTHGDMIIAPTRHRLGNSITYHLMARGYEWVFLMHADAKGMERRFPYLGADATFSVPPLALDRKALFAKIRQQFPQAIRKGRADRRGSD